MAPVSVAGTLTQVLAEVLAGVAYSQLIRKGAPVIFGAFVTSIDMNSGAPTFGTPEAAQITYGAGQLARRLGLPYRSAGAFNGSKLPDAQAAYETANSLNAGLLAGVNFMLHAAGWLEGGLVASFEKFVMDADQLGAVHKFAAGVEPLRVKDLAEVGIGSNFRTGAALENGEEAVLGTVMMLAGENSRIVAHRVAAELEVFQSKLPPGVVLRIQYDRSSLVDRTIHTVRNNLFEGAVLVVAVLLVMLGNWRAALIGAAAWFAIAWTFHQKMIEAATGARGITRKQAPDLYNMLENLSIAAGRPMPKLAVIETPALNAFASGINDKTYTVTLTRGLIDALDRDELQAVMAHELTHIENRDVRLLIISVIFVGVFSFVGEIVFRNFWRLGMRPRQPHRREDGRSQGLMLILAAAIIAVAYALAVLQKISGRSRVEAPADVAQMFIHNEAKFMSLFATHPPIPARIEALRRFAGGRS